MWRVTSVAVVGFSESPAKPASSNAGARDAASVRVVRYAKGAPEVILDRCDRVRVDGDVQEFADGWVN